MADRFRVKVGNWDLADSWATTSGGTTFAAVPTVADNTFFDANTPTGTHTINVAAAVLNLDFTNTTVVTIAGTSTLNIRGSLTFVANVTRTYTGALTFSAVDSRTVTLAGKALASTISFNGVGGTWTLQDTLTTTAGLTLTNGTFAANSQLVQLTGSAQTITGVFTFFNLTRTGTAAKTDTLTFAGNQTITGTLTINGNSLIDRLLVRSSIVGTVRTITAAAISLSNCDFSDITGAGLTANAAWTGTSIGDALGNSNITRTALVSRYWMAVSGGNWDVTTSWSTASNGATGASVPLCHDNVFIDASSITSAARTITANQTRLGANIDFTGVLNTPLAALTTATTVFGNLTFISGMTISGTTLLTLAARSAVNFTTGGLTHDRSITVTAFGGTVTQVGNLTTGATRTFTLLDGTYNINDYSLTTGVFSTLGATRPRTLTMGSGTVELTGTGQVWAWANPTNLTLNAGTSTIKITNTSNTGRQFFGSEGGAVVYNNIWHDAGASTAFLALTGPTSITINDFKDTGTAAHDIRFRNGTTTTFTTFTVSGIAGNIFSIRTTGDVSGALSTATHTLSAPSRSNVSPISCDYLDIQNSIATQANTWYAGVNSVNNQGVATAGSGWVFSAPVSLGNSLFFGSTF